MSIDATIPIPTYKPGFYFGFNTTLASRALATNDQKLVILAQRTTLPTAAERLTPVDVFSDEEAAVYFGRGSQAHRMAKAAIYANGYLQLAIVGLEDAAGGVAATGSLALSGTATGTGQARLSVCGVTAAAAVASGDSAEVVMTALADAINTRQELPVSASVEDIPAEGGSKSTGKQITLIARNKGTVGNQVGLTATVNAAGLTATLKAMSGGQGDPELDDALAAIFSAGHTLVISPYSDTASLRTLSTHLDKVSGPLEQRGAVGVTGWNGTLSTGTTLTTAVNAARITMGWYNGSALPNGELAAVYAAIMASESDPARPLNTLTLPGLDITGQDKWPGRTEQENALSNGLTPFEVSGSTVQIVRAVSTYVKNAMGVTDRSLMDITIIRSLDYVRLACRTRMTQRFPREKLTDTRLARIRSELLDVLYALEALEIVENVDALKDQLIVTRNLQDDTRADATIPASIVRGLHVFAGTIYLL
ncbi:phage tail sheath subtilisin-like domain-containing protein [Serratia sp. OPWLW2]|uniref:phage tail sheath subtilisin-like domain-containing protein n=1 Tax=Serratia sp. OPWLW2 TaxID=1928658 RepID=UPI000C18B60C|nr:phage tail sheath subtilisin-like domain-containing protein [Serratia sp. OPWLW2]PIJ41589.1 phage tail protein [Serratia sp. OPWLW2]